MNIEVDPERVVARSPKLKDVWGVWQFPTIARISKSIFTVNFYRHEDNASLDATGRESNGNYISKDGGKSWRPQGKKAQVIDRNRCHLNNGRVVFLKRPECRDIPKKKLPEALGFRNHGYSDSFSFRDPEAIAELGFESRLVGNARGRLEFKSSPVKMTDPDGGFFGYDPPDKPHAVIHANHYENLIELPNGELLISTYGFRRGASGKPRQKWECYCLRSCDKGKSWVFQGIIARNDRHFLAGFTEPNITLLADGSILAVVRTECSKAGPMYRSRSTDGGKTWSRPKRFYPFGVLPRLITLANGVTVLAFGRPGTHLLFSRDGRGETWENFTPIVKESMAPNKKIPMNKERFGFQKGEDPKGRPAQTRTSGYADLVATGPDRFTLVYDQFDYPDPKGKPRKTILVRDITVLT